MVWLTWFVLSQPTNDPQCPGVIGDYAPLWDFRANIECDPAAKKIKLHTRGKISNIGEA